MDLPDPSSMAALLIAFAAGAVSFLSPCVAPLLPGYIAFVAGSTSTTRSGTLARAGGFVAGFILLFALLGATAAGVTQLLVRERAVLELAGGLIVALLGLAMTFDRSIIPAGATSRLQGRLATTTAPSSAIAAMPVGAAFAVAWSPCIGPVLASILTVAASDAQPGRGAVLLIAYGIGLGLPFLLGAIAIERVTLIAKAMRRHQRRIRQVSGIALLLLGVAIATGSFGQVTAWIARLVPSWML